MAKSSLLLWNILRHLRFRRHFDNKPPQQQIAFAFFKLISTDKTRFCLPMIADVNIDFSSSHVRAFFGDNVNNAVNATSPYKDGAGPRNTSIH